MTRKKKPTASLVRSSAAEYLTFVATSGTGGVEAAYADENVWLSQKMMAQLYDVEVPTINYHLKKVFEDSELEEDSVIRKFRITAADGKTYDTKHYDLSAIIAVGYKVNSERAVLFRKWATRVVEEFTIKGFAMDDERLKRGGSVLSDRYFEEQLQRVREIRLSERKFYQKITDIYATSVDYDVTAQATKRFFATVQNKLHWAIHGQTAAEVIKGRADATKEHMGLHSWADAPLGKVQKFDVVVAKNYLTEHELAQLSRLVNAYLDVAEDMALRKLPMTMQDWETRLNRFLDATDRAVLQDAGKVTAEIARAHAESEFEKYRIVQDRLFESDFDRVVTETKRLGEGAKGTPRKVEGDDIVVSRPVDLVVLACKSNALRCRLLGSAREVTLRTAVRDEIPGSIITVTPKKQWTHARHPYLSGDVSAVRIDASALGLVPLALHREDRPHADAGRDAAADGRPVYRLAHVAPASDDAGADLLLDAQDCIDARAYAEADELLHKVLALDLRHLDAHALLGERNLSSWPTLALHQFELGVAIGSLTVGDDFDGMLPWGFVENRPFLRCLHGLSRALLRRDRREDAAAALRRLLRLDPTDHLGAGAILAAIETGKTWRELETAP